MDIIVCYRKIWLKLKISRAEQPPTSETLPKGWPLVAAAFNYLVPVTHTFIIVPGMASRLSTLIRYYLFYWLSPGGCGIDFKWVIFKSFVMITCLTISRAIAFLFMVQESTDDKSTSVQVLPWCRQATGHYPSHCSPRSMSPNGVTKSNLFNLKFYE